MLLLGGDVDHFTQLLDDARRPAALTDALRQRRRLPASITPLGTH